MFKSQPVSTNDTNMIINSNNIGRVNISEPSPNVQFPQCKKESLLKTKLQNIDIQ